MKRNKLLFALMLSLSLPLTACLSANQHTEHTYSGGWCFNEQYHWHECDMCYETTDVAAHNFSSWTLVEEATCLSEGLQFRICDICGYKQEEILPSGNHRWESEWTVDKESDCTHHGEKSHHCRDCDERTDITELPLDPNKHCPSEAVREDNVEPTCTQSGHYDEVVYCEYCHKELSRESFFVPAKGHVWSDEWTIDVEPACNHTGEKSHHCLVCDERKDIEVIPVTDDHHGGEPVRENEILPTCTENGSYDELVFCKDCGKLLSEEHHVVPALGHDWSDEWTVDVAPNCAHTGEKSHHCLRCDARKDITVLEKTTDHVLEEPMIINNVEPTCTENGSYDELYYCSICHELIYENHVIVPALGHDWSDEWTLDVAPTCVSDGQRSHHCLRCDALNDVEVVPATDEHTPIGPFEENYIEPTCTEDGSVDLKTICSVCGEVLSVEHKVLPALGHNWSDEWTLDITPTCTHGGEKSHHCLVCDARNDVTELDIDPNNHNPGEPVHEHDVAPTCSSEGSYEENVYCQDCHALLDSVEHSVPTTPHTYGEWIVDVKPTAVTTGEHHHICEECGHSESEVMPCAICHYEIREDNVYLVSEEGDVQVDLTYEGNYFDENGVMHYSGFFFIEGETFYLVDNVVFHGFIVINDYLYYFTDTGAMFHSGFLNDFDLNGDGNPDSLYFNDYGHCEVGDGFIFTLNDFIYLLDGESVRTTASASIKVFASDADLIERNNQPLSGVSVSYTSTHTSGSGSTNENGVVNFVSLEYGVNTLVLSLSGYKSRTVQVNVNALENEYKFALDYSVSNTLNGRVTIADSDSDYTNNPPLSDANLTLTRIGDYVEIPEPQFTVTDSSGLYTFTNLTAGVYELIVAKEGYKTVRDIVKISANMSTTQNVVIEAVSEENIENGSVSGQVRDAAVQTLTPIAGITCKVRNGIDVDFGEVDYETTTDSNGRYSIELAPGNYTIQFVDEREDAAIHYISASIVVKVLSNMTLQNQDAALTREFNGLRAVLTWGSSPSDLDSHILFSNGEHVYYSHKNGNYASLDVDDTSSYGPETITVTNLSASSFVYYIHDYTNRNSSSSTALSRSGAKVVVYLGGEDSPIYTFNVPSGSGYYWKVFSYNVTTQAFTVYNTVGTSTPSI